MIEISKKNQMKIMKVEKMKIKKMVRIMEIKFKCTLKIFNFIVIRMKIMSTNPKMNHDHL